MATYTTKAPIQTPAVFVKAGGAAMWSSACIDALLEAGYNPDAFGSYNHVRKEIAKARRRIDDEAAGRTDANGNPIRALPSDHHMARSQAGHLSMDATHRQAGGRSNDCANLNDGYSTSRAPCMPQSEGPWDPRGSEHNVASRHEAASAAAARETPPPSAYPPALRDQHEDHRTEQVVATRDPNNPRQPINRADWESQRDGERRDAVELAGGGDGGSATAPAGVDGTSAAIDSASDEAPTAAECINAFRRAAMAQMEKDLSDERGAAAADHRSKVTDPAEQARLDQAAADARQHANEVNQSLGSAVGHCTRNENAIAARTTGDRPSAEDGELLQRSRSRSTAAQNYQAAVERRATQAERAAARGRVAGCLADEGDRANPPNPVAPGTIRPNTPNPPGSARAPDMRRVVPADQRDSTFGADREAWGL